MWPWIPKKLLKWKKARNILFHSQLILYTFCEKITFLTAPAQSCCCCGQFDISGINVFDDLLHLLISLARSVKYFNNVELLYPSDTFQTLWIFNMVTCSYLIPWCVWPTGCWGLNLNMWTCWRSKVIEIQQILLLWFCLNKDQFWFLFMLRTSSAEVRRKLRCREMQSD